MTAMNRARRLFLAAGLLVAVGVTVGTAWAAVISCKAGVSCYGTSGPDELQGTRKKDYLYGKAGNDTLKGGRGNDVLFGDAAIDTGADGNDQLYGGPGDDTLYDGGGSDLIVGGSGNDAISANADQTFSNPGEDTIRAGKGNDLIEAEDDHKDTIDCGPGIDEVYFDQGLDKVAANCEKQHPL